MRRSRPCCGRPARSSSARPTCTSSRSAPPATTPASARRGTRSIPRDRRAARAAGRRSPSRPAWPSPPSAPTPAAPSASPPRRAASSGSSPRGARFPRQAWCRSAASWITSGPMTRSVADAWLMYDVMRGARELSRRGARPRRCAACASACLTATCSIASTRRWSRWCFEPSMRLGAARRAGVGRRHRARRRHAARLPAAGAVGRSGVSRARRSRRRRATTRRTCASGWRWAAT